MPRSGFCGMAAGPQKARGRGAATTLSGEHSLMAFYGISDILQVDKLQRLMIPADPEHAGYGGRSYAGRLEDCADRSRRFQTHQFWMPIGGGAKLGFYGQHAQKWDELSARIADTLRLLGVNVFNLLPHLVHMMSLPGQGTSGPFTRRACAATDNQWRIFSRLPMALRSRW